MYKELAAYKIIDLYELKTTKNLLQIAQTFELSESATTVFVYNCFPYGRIKHASSGKKWK